MRIGSDASAALMDAAGLLQSGAPALAGALVAACAAFGLSRLAPRWGWLDSPDAGRKLQARGVPPVGGAAVLLGLLVGAGVPLGEALARILERTAEVWGLEEIAGQMPGPLACWSTLLLAFGVGLADDLAPRGLRARAKLALQIAVGLPAALSLCSADGLGVVLGLACLCAAPVALNAVNTFDNTDGGAGSLGALALLGPVPAAAAAVVGFLPFNLDARAAHASDSHRAVPSCYLGDSGSHLLGGLILLVPAAWPALALPLLDLLRLCPLRLARGSRPWLGDRRHLAHRLEAAGLPRAGVLCALTLVALPALWIGGMGVRGGELEALGLGLAGTLLLFVVAVWVTPDPEAAAQ